MCALKIGKTRIAGFIGSNMGKFRVCEGEIHDAAMELDAAARQKNGQGAINAFQKLQAGRCNCRRGFCKPFVERFYGARRSDRDKGLIAQEVSHEY